MGFVGVHCEEGEGMTPTSPPAPLLKERGAELSGEQKERIGRFLLAVLEWDAPAPPPTPPQISSLRSEYLERGEEAVSVS